MKKIILIVLIGVLVSFFTSSCTSQDKKVSRYIENTKVISLKETIVATDQMARAWEEDAYLTLASVSFGWSDSSDFQVFYESPSQPNIALWIYSENGVVTQETIGSLMDQSKEISLKDWVVDSSELFKIVLNQKDVVGFAEKASWGICGYQNLNKSNRFSAHPLLWQVQVKNCSNPIESISIYLDPISGNLIEGGN